MPQAVEKPQTSFEYGWCKTDHKDGMALRPAYRNEDYVFGEKHRARVAAALAALGLTQPEDAEVYRGTYHDILFLDSHGIVVRIGPTDPVIMMHPAILQPLGWRHTDDPDVSIALYPGIEHGKWSNNNGPRQLRNLLSDAGYGTTDVYSNNIGVIRVDDGALENYIPVLLDMDNKYNGLQSDTDRENTRTWYMDMVARGIKPSAIMHDAIKNNVAQLMTKNGQGDDYDADAAETYKYLTALETVFMTHQPLRHLFWQSFARAGVNADMDLMHRFWDRCRAVLKKPERVTLHHWRQETNAHGVNVWIKDQNIIETLSLARPWTNSAADKVPRYSGPRHIWSHYLTDIENGSIKFSDLPLEIQKNKKFCVSCYHTDPNIIDDMPTDHFSDTRFMLTLADANVLKMIKHIPPALYSDRDFMIGMIVIHYETFAKAAPALKENIDFIIDALKANYYCSKKIDSELIKNKEDALRVIPHYTGVYRKLKTSLQRDPDIASLVISLNPRMFADMPSSLYDNEDIAKQAMKADPWGCHYQRLSARLRERADIALMAIENVRYDSDIPHALQRRPHFAKDCLRVRVGVFGELPDSLRHKKSMIFFTLDRVQSMLDDKSAQPSAVAKLVLDHVLPVYLCDDDIIACAVSMNPRIFDESLSMAQVAKDYDYMCGLVARHVIRRQNLPSNMLDDPSIMARLDADVRRARTAHKAAAPAP